MTEFDSLMGPPLTEQERAAWLADARRRSELAKERHLRINAIPAIDGGFVRRDAIVRITPHKRASPDGSLNEIESGKSVVWGIGIGEAVIDMKPAELALLLWGRE